MILRIRACVTVDYFPRQCFQFYRVLFYAYVQLNSLRLDSGKSELTEHISHLEEQLQKHRLHVEQFHSNSTALRQMKAQVCDIFYKGMCWSEFHLFPIKFVADIVYENSCCGSACWVTTD